MEQGVLRFVGLFLLLDKSSRAAFNETYITCLACFDVESPSYCRKSLTCGQGEICYAREFTDHRGLKGFRLGCEDRAICNIFQNAKFLLGKRNTAPSPPEKCFECCTGDECNGRLCHGAGDHDMSTVPTTSITSTTTPLPATTSSTSTSSTTSRSACPRNYIPFEDSCYLFVKRTDTWSRSREYCRNLSADLVIINSQREQDFLNMNFKECEAAPNYPSIWIGGRFSDSSSRFQWVDGSSLQYTNWQGGKPNQMHYNMVMWSSCYSSVGGKWLVDDGLGAAYAICEKQKI